jgi:hypothetical protein
MKRPLEIARGLLLAVLGTDWVPRVMKGAFEVTRRYSVSLACDFFAKSALTRPATSTAR